MAPGRRDGRVEASEILGGRTALSCGGSHARGPSMWLLHAAGLMLSLRGQRPALPTRRPWPHRAAGQGSSEARIHIPITSGDSKSL